MKFDPLPEVRRPPLVPEVPRRPTLKPPPGPAAKTTRVALFWVVPVLATVVLAILTGIGVAAVIHVPGVESVYEFTPGLITQVYDTHGTEFATYARETRVLLKEGDVPPVLANAILAAEDSKFFQHGGIDPVGVLRAAVEDVRRWRYAQGASTITMQLARLLFFTREKTWRRKIEETLTAVELEKRLSKQQILTLYCNLINLGHGNYGVEAASRFYFNKSVSDITLPEAATLAAIIQRPSKVTPYLTPDAIVRRRNAVLGLMLEEKFITPEEHSEAVEEALIVRRHRKHRIGAYFSEHIRRYLETTYGVRGLYQRGLQVRTTLNLDMQRLAESALRTGLQRIDAKKGYRGPILHLEEEDLDNHRLPSWSGEELTPGSWNEGIVLETDPRSARVKIDDTVYTLTAEGIAWTGKRQPGRVLKRGDVAWFRLQLPEAAGEEAVLVLEQEPEVEGALVVLESATGAVRAMVGGWDFERNQFNRVTQARRQVGSAFKPFVFGAALEMGFTPADTLFDGPVVFPDAENQLTYSPRNYYRRYYGIITLRRALELSINVSSVKLLDLVGAERVVDFAQRCGIRSVLPPYPSLALGSADLSPLELATAYATIANQGIHVEPYFIESIANQSGVVLERHETQATKAMEPEIAYVLTHMLEGVVDRGTAAKVADLELDLAGKTGTTDDYTDAWFAGFTPKYTLLVWIGYDLQKRIGPNMTGAEAALPIWREMVTGGIEAGWLKKTDRFISPPGVQFRNVEYLTGLLPTTGTERTLKEAFVTGTEPAREYDPRWSSILRLPWYQQRAFYGIPKEGERMPEDIDDWTLVREAWESK